MPVASHPWHLPGGFRVRQSLGSPHHQPALFRTAWFTLLLKALPHTCFPLLPAQVIGGIYLAAFESGSFGSPAALPRQLSRVCVPNPAAVDNEACQSVSRVAAGCRAPIRLAELCPSLLPVFAWNLRRLVHAFQTPRRWAWYRVSSATQPAVFLLNFCLLLCSSKRATTACMCRASALAGLLH